MSLMRFILPSLLFAAWLAVSFHASATQDAKQTVEPIHALKQALDKNTSDLPAPKDTSEKSAAPARMPSWTELSKEQRRAILNAWQNLPEATRQPFPVYRDMMIEKQCAPKTLAKSAATNVSVNKK